MSAYNIIGSIVVGGALLTMLIAVIVGIREDSRDRS